MERPQLRISVSRGRLTQTAPTSVAQLLRPLSGGVRGCGFEPQALSAVVVLSLGRHPMSLTWCSGATCAHCFETEVRLVVVVEHGQQSVIRITCY